MTQNIHQVFDESIGQTPDDMSVRNPNENTGVSSLRPVGSGVFDASSLLEHVGQWKPESVLDFLRSKLEFLSFGQIEGMGRNDEGWARPRVAHDIIEPAEVFRVLQLDANLLEGFSLRSAAGRSVYALQSASRKRHVPRPGIPLSYGPLDQKYFDRSRALSKHDRNGGVRLARRRGLLWDVRAKSLSNEIDLHARQLSEREATARASSSYSG
jgi:hypothetical protein